MACLWDWERALQSDTPRVTIDCTWNSYFRTTEWLLNEDSPHGYFATDQSPAKNGILTATFMFTDADTALLFKLRFG